MPRLMTPKLGASQASHELENAAAYAGSPRPLLSFCMASASVSDICSSTTILDEQSLRQLSRRAKQLLPVGGYEPKNQNDVVKYVETFRLVIRTTSSETLATTHQVAAWNTLSTFLDQTAVSSDLSIRSILWTARLWQDSLLVFLTRSVEARPKSIKQLLVALTSALHKTQDDAESLQERQSTIQLLVTCVLRRDDRWPVRPCLMLLSNLLRKGVTGLEQIAKAGDFPSQSDCVDALLQACMEWTAIDDCASTSGQLLDVLLERADADKNDGAEPRWAQSLSSVLQRQPDAVHAFRLHLMPTLFKREPAGFLWLLQHFNLTAHFDSSKIVLSKDVTVLLAALQVGIACALVEVSSGSVLDASSCPVQLPVSLLVSLLRHAGRSMRLNGLSLLINTSSISQPFHKAALEALKSNLPHLHADTDLNFRSELFSLSQRLLDRLRTSTSNRARVLQNTQSAVEGDFSAERNFISWYKRFLMWELRPGASYQRHISALRCLGILMRSGVDQALPIDSLSKAAKAGGKWPFNVQIIDDDFEQVLITLILDPFDDVRQVAAGLLETYIKATASSEEQYGRLLGALAIAEEKMLASGRADQADAVAHIYALLYSCSGTNGAHETFLELVTKAELMLETAKASLATAVERYPLHGILTSLRYLLDKPTSQDIVQEDIYDRLVRILDSIWTVVSPILCDDAPEGFMSDDISSSTTTVSSKDVLSYCWRALKEASSLIDSILLGLSKKSQDWALKQKVALIELTFTQLAELRHRGAFSTVAQTWSRCCMLAGDDVTLPTMLRRVIFLIQKNTINTRRSAGMPSLLCGILVAGPEELLEEAFAELNVISRQEVQQGFDDESSLPQVHAMNCLKDILKSTRLAERSERFVPVALQLAADSLPSSTWAIRNCGLMLFRAVIDRLLGTNDSYEEDTKVKNVMDFRQRRGLLDHILSLLPIEQQGVVLEGVFPALQLLQHSILPEDRKPGVLSLVQTLLGNHSWHIRDKAARTLVSLMAPHALMSDSIVGLTEFQAAVSSHNMLHGVLLCLKHLFRVAKHKGTDCLPVQDLLEVDRLLQHVVQASHCQVLREAAYRVQQQGRNVAQRATSAPILASTSRTSDLMAVSALCSFSSPEEADRWLRERGSWLNMQSELTHALLLKWQDYITACVSATDEDSVFTKDELVSHLDGLVQGLQSLWNSLAGKQVTYNICLLVYDLLNDDDEDVRLQASQIASAILGLCEENGIGGCYEPIVAGHKLLAFMIAAFADKDEFGEECLRRAFDMGQTSPATFALLLGETGAQDTELFAEEKQNLYLDETLETKAWSQAAKRLGNSVRLNIHDLAGWTDAALDALLAKAQSPHPSAFGWSTSEMVFPFGLRVIYAVEFLLHHVTVSGDKLGVPPSQLREKLLRLESAAEAALLHPLWRAELQRVSKIAAVSRFSAIQSLLNGVVGQLSSATTL